MSLVMLFIVLYFLLGRGFPAKTENPMLIDWCLGFLATLYICLICLIVTHALREWCCPPAPGAAEYTSLTEAEPEEGGVQRTLSDLAVGGQVSETTQPNEPGGDSQASDRQRVEENRRRIAAEAMFRRAMPILLGIMVTGATFFVTGIVAYVEGWYVYAEYRHKKCDQPLGQWLLEALLFPIFFLCIIRFCGERGYCMGFGWLIGIGFVYWDGSKTCYATNPELHHFVQMYLLYYFLLWTNCFLLSLGTSGVALLMHNAGLLKSAAKPGSPGLIKEMDVVTYAPNLQPPECCICQEDFAEDGPIIRRTPCDHIFHEACLGEWLENFGRTCPLCRLDLEEAIFPTSSRNAAGLNRTPQGGETTAET